MNLYTYYPSIYWATACLIVNGGAADQEVVNIKEKEDDNSEYEDLPDRSGKIKSTTNYGKLGTAIGRITEQNIVVRPPNINLSRFGFTPECDTNSIIYGLKGISGVSNSLVLKIMETRPYTSFDDFVEKTSPSKTEAIALIKSGAFDELENMPRRDLMFYYLQSITPKKNKLTLANVSTLIKYKIIGEQQKNYIFLYNFNKYLRSFKDGDYFKLDERAYTYFDSHYDVDDLEVINGKSMIRQRMWENLYKKDMEPLKVFLNENYETLAEALQNAEIEEIWAQYCDGSISAWEMETLGFYYHNHELINVSHAELDLVDYLTLPDVPVPERIIEIKGHNIPIQKLVPIVGTVLDKNAIKHTIAILTPSGVVNCKMKSEDFSKYDKQISTIDPLTKQKRIVDKSWFKRGTKLALYGYRNNGQFYVRGREKENKYPVYKILNIDDFGELELMRYRMGDLDE